MGSSWVAAARGAAHDGSGGFDLDSPVAALSCQLHGRERHPAKSPHFYVTEPPPFCYSDVVGSAMGASA